MDVSVAEKRAPFRRRGRLVQFSLRSLIVLMVVMGTAVGWVGSLIRTARVKESAAELLRQSEVHVTYTFRPVTQILPANEWTRKIFGRQFFDQVSEIQTQELEAAPIVNQIKYFPHLQRVFLLNSYANDETFGYLAKCPDLAVIYAGGTAVKDAGVQALGEARSLEQLVLWNTRIGDEAIEAISSLPRLECLLVQDTAITDQAIRALHKSAAGKKLTELNVSGTSVTAESLEAISEFESLEILVFRGIPVSLSDLRVLAEMPNLKRLYVSGLDADSQSHLEESLPNCYVHCSDITVAGPR